MTILILPQLHTAPPCHIAARIPAQLDTGACQSVKFWPWCEKLFWMQMAAGLIRIWPVIPISPIGVIHADMRHPC